MEKSFIINGTEYKVSDHRLEGDIVSFKFQGQSFSFKLLSRDGMEMTIQGAERFKAVVGTQTKEGESMVIAGPREASVTQAGKKTKKAGGHVGGLTSPMPGKIFKILKEIGSDVKKGEVILILEAMKMEHAIRSDKDGKVKKINYQLGELVQGGVVLAELE
jgi:glutaconyl-CoA/methylmalonyl-CoA decarboxylase subunit gamma